MQSSSKVDLTATHLRHGAEAYQSNVTASVDGIVRQTVLRDGLTIVSASFRLKTELSSQVLLPPGLSLSMVLCGRSLLADDEPHGSGTYVVNLSSRSCWRRVRAGSGQTVRFVSLTASPTQLRSLGLEGVLKANEVIARHGRMPDRVAGLALLLAQHEQASPTHSLLREAAGLELVGRLLGDVSTPDRDDGLGPLERRALDQIQAIIAAELGADLTLAALARRVGLGLSRLKTLYQRRYGTSLGAGIIEARLARAHRLLSEDSRQVGEIAYAVGYTPAHFATSFRRRFGYPPSAVRRARPG